MSLVAHAEYELIRAGLFDSDSDYDGALGKAVMELIEKFAEQGHSGASAAMTIKLFYELAQFHPLGGVTSNPDEWVEFIQGQWQNRRRGSTFSRDGGKTWYDIDDETLNNGDHWNNYKGKGNS